MKRSSLPPLSPAQLEIMHVVWERGEVTVAEVWKELAAHRPVARNTVQTVMTRLEEKGWLPSRTDTHAFRYRAAAPRASALGALVRRLVDTAFAGSAEGLVLALLDGRGVTKAEAQKIRSLIDRAEKK